MAISKELFKFNLTNWMMMPTILLRLIKSGEESMPVKIQICKLLFQLSLQRPFKELETLISKYQKTHKNFTKCLFKIGSNSLITNYQTKLKHLS